MRLTHELFGNPLVVSQSYVLDRVEIGVQFNKPGPENCNEHRHDSDPVPSVGEEDHYSKRKKDE